MLAHKKLVAAFADETLSLSELPRNVAGHFAIIFSWLESPSVSMKGKDCRVKTPPTVKNDDAFYCCFVEAIIASKGKFKSLLAQ